MDLRFPAPLQPGDVIAVTSPSAGVPDQLRPRLDLAIKTVEDAGFGFSDISTLLTPLTLLTGWATLHGQNLMDTPYRSPEGLADWLDIVQQHAGSEVVQTSPRSYRQGFVDYVDHPEVSEYVLDTPGTWTRLDGSGGVDVQGRLIGGCIETLVNLAGTHYLDTAPLAALGDGLILYVEAAGHDAATICRNLHGMRLAGFFDGASAVLVGRTEAPPIPTLTQHEAVLDALGGLGVPLLADVECGHVAPYMPLVNGARCRVQHSTSESRVRQVLA